MGAKRGAMGGGAAALAEASPEGAVAAEGAAMARRFWGGLIDALGKNAYDSSRVKAGRKVVQESHHALGYTRTRQLVDGKRVVCERFEIARWEMVPLALGAALAASVALKATAKGQALSAKVKGSAAYQALPTLPLPGFPGSANAPQTNALGIPFKAGWGGGANPLNYLP